MTSHTVGPLSAPAWGASPAGPSGGPAAPGGLGSLGARRSLLGDLLGGGAILIAWTLLWTWFALAMVQPAARPAASAAAAIERLA